MIIQGFYNNEFLVELGGTDTWFTLDLIWSSITLFALELNVRIWGIWSLITIKSFFSIYLNQTLWFDELHKKHHMISWKYFKFYYFLFKINFEDGDQNLIKVGISFIRRYQTYEEQKVKWFMPTQSVMFKSSTSRLDVKFTKINFFFLNVDFE